MQFSKLAKAGLMTATFALLSTQAYAFSAAATIALNVRAGPGTGYVVVDTLYRGEVVDITECRSNGWCMISHSGPDGWASAKYLTQSASQPSSSAANDAAAAAALGIFAGVAGVIINNAINQNRPAPKCPPGTVWNNKFKKCMYAGGARPGPICPPGTVWNNRFKKCIPAGGARPGPFCPPGKKWNPFLKRCI